MNINGVLFRLISIVLGSLIMSFAWPLRGQFGSEWGSAIVGAFAGCIWSVLIPWRSFRASFAQAVFFGSIGFIVGGENIPYGKIIDYILQQPDLSGVIPQLLTLLFIGATWGGIGSAYLGYGISEKPVTGKDFLFLFILGVATIYITNVILNQNQQYFVYLSAVFLTLLAYNALFKKSKTIIEMAFSGLIGFGFGFLGAVIILFYGNKGYLPGPSGWWTLRDQMWGAAGGLALIAASWRAVRRNRQPVAITAAWFQRFGFIYFVPAVCGVNLWNVWTKWFQSTPPAPNLQLAGILLFAGAVLLTGWFIFYLKTNPAIFLGEKFNTLLLASVLSFALFLKFFAIAKSIVYSGWGVWETGFSLFEVDGLLLMLVLPFVLLGDENP